MNRTVCVMAATLCALGLLAATGLAQATKPKATIKEVMKEAHKDGLLKKVTEGKASKEEQERLQELYTALSEGKPSKGDEKSWKDKTTALLDAAKSVIKGDAGAVDALKKASNCQACHKAHR